MSISTILRIRSGRTELFGGSGEAVCQAQLFQRLAISAALLGDCTRGRLYTLECLILFCSGEYMRGQTSHVKVWTFVGLVVRLAMHMGYHCDAQHYHNIGPFHGEMRRRIWHFIYQIDVLLSFQLGLPGMIREMQSDTRPPHNFLDNDISPGLDNLPAARS